MMDEEKNGFDSWKNYILKSLDEIKETIVRMDEKNGIAMKALESVFSRTNTIQGNEITNMKIELAAIKTKIMFIGAIAGIIASGVVSLLIKLV